MLGGGGTVIVQVKNTTDHPLAFYYNKHYANSPYLVGELRGQDGSVTELRARKDLQARREVLEPGQVVAIFRPIDPRPAGTYTVRYRIDIPHAVAQEWQRKEGEAATKVWSGSVQTNEVTLRWRPE
jgi:hypothetical protein